MAAGPLQLMIAPFPEGFSGDMDQQWQQAAQLLEGTVITSTVPTPQKLYFCFPTPWPIAFKGSKDQTWAKGISLLLCTTGTQTIPLAITPFPDGFQGNLNETWQQGLKLITATVP